MLRTALLILLAALAPPALAWNAAGHRIVARIAWLELTPAARTGVSELLARHPDAERWIQRAKTNASANLFVEAATWPDDIRSDERFHDDDDAAPAKPTPTFPDASRHRRWHYLDLPLTGGANTSDGELDTQLPRLIQQLAHHPQVAERAYALPWVIHLVGDIHQPLHVASRGDEGGNAHEMEDPFNARLPFTNLHRWWDDRPGPPWLRDERLERAAQRYLQNFPQRPAPGGMAVWLKESRTLAREFAYPSEVGSLLPIVTERFKNQAETVTGQQLVKAGKRLAEILEQIFGAVPRGTQ